MKNIPIPKSMGRLQKAIYKDLIEIGITSQLYKYSWNDGAYYGLKLKSKMEKLGYELEVVPGKQGGAWGGRLKLVKYPSNNQNIYKNKVWFTPEDISNIFNISKTLPYKLIYNNELKSWKRLVNNRIYYKIHYNTLNQYIKNNNSSKVTLDKCLSYLS